ncbi:MAG TPA: DUF6263 family protein [Verrucomicrobiae bacterium]|nr:DUF6263 family protein [Verrucomicrobiae bacterium]
MKILWVFVMAALSMCAGCKKSETPGKSASSSASSDASLPDDGQPVTLRVKWPVGNRYAERMQVDGNTETHMPMSPKPMLQKIDLSQEYSVTVLGERPNGGRELELEFESAEMDVTMNGKPVVNLDTKAEAGPAESNPAVAGFRQIIGAKIKFHVDASNRVEKVEGVKEFSAKASAGSNPQGRAAMQSMFNEDYFKQMVDFQRSLPPQPVKKGDTWPVKTEINAPVLGAMNIDLNYTFQGWEQRDNRKCAAMDFAGTMSSKGDAAAASTGMSMKVESGKLSGKTWFDPELGHPVETSLNQDMVLHMTMPMPRMRTNTNAAVQAPTSQNITNNTKQNVVIKLVEVVSAAK